MDNLRLIFFLTFHRNKFDYGFVENLTAYLLEKESALKIKKKKSYSQNTQRSISPGAPDNIGAAHQSMKEYAIAFENYEKSLPNNHSDLVTTHNSMATALVALGDFKNAYEHEQKAVEIVSQSLSPDHPNLQTFQNHLEIIQLNENT
jgi:tetratricopeptide (TPR) repeat protein